MRDFDDAALALTYRGTAKLLGEVVEHDDAYTGLHTRGVVSMALKVGARLGLDESQIVRIESAALLHDVGKIEVPKRIVNKQGPLDEGEWEIIKTHTIKGQRMLHEIGGLMEEIGTIVRSCHERWDGRGYPDGLAGEQIPVESRVIFCCDAFNAMTTDRSYRKALGIQRALTEIRQNAGTQFDPDAAMALVEVIEEMRPAEFTEGTIPVSQLLVDEATPASRF